jgi:hypothetical protein
VVQQLAEVMPARERLTDPSNSGPRVSRKLWGASLLSSVALVLCWKVYWTPTLEDYSWSNGEARFDLLVACVFGVVLVWWLGASRHWFQRTAGWHMVVPLVVCLLALASVTVVPGPRFDFGKRWDFTTNLQRREDVIALVQSGTLRPPGTAPGLVSLQLPPADVDLSLSGAVAVQADQQQTTVVFPVVTGSLFCTESGGWAYRSDGTPPSPAQFAVTLKARLNEVTAVQPDWYWVTYTGECMAI